MRRRKNKSLKSGQNMLDVYSVLTLLNSATIYTIRNLLSINFTFIKQAIVLFILVDVQTYFPTYPFASSVSFCRKCDFAKHLICIQQCKLYYNNAWCRIMSIRYGWTQSTDKSISFLHTHSLPIIICYLSLTGFLLHSYYLLTTCNVRTFLKGSFSGK